VRRIRTNTPLQALAGLNDEASFEAARALAGRMARESPAGGDVTGTNRARAAHGFRLCTSRRPTADETARIVASFEKQLAAIRAQPGAAARITKDEGGGGADLDERAAWTLVANALLNLDETLTK
jgi:Protein of unknown function (DUF1553)